MRISRSKTSRVFAAVTAVALLAGPSAALAQEASPTPSPEGTPVPISEDAPPAPLQLKDNTFALGQSMQIRVNADGEPNSSLLNFRWTVSQLTVQGPADGSKDGSFEVPVPEGGTMARYLTSFGKPSVQDGVAAFDVDVKNGSGLQRTVSLFPQDAAAPVELQTRFTLDGEEITAKDLVGKSGVVTAQYTLINKTAEPTEVTVKDLAGKDVTKTVDADVPMVAIAKTLLPQRFVGLNTGAGQFGADGRGNNQVQWVALPFKPLSQDGTARFGWSANVTDAVIPSILLQVAPVYLGAHVDDPGTPNVDEGRGGGAPPVNLDPAMAEIQAGLASVIAGVETLTAGDGTDPLQTVEDKLNNFFSAFGTNLKTVSSLIDPTNPDSVTSLLGDAVPILQQITGPISTVNENWDAVSRVVDFVAAQPSGLVFAGLLNGAGVPDVPPFGDGNGSWSSAEASALIDFARGLQPQMDAIGGQISVVAPLLATLTPIAEALLTALTDLSAQIAIIGNGLEAANVDLPAIDAVIASVVASVLASPGGQQITGGLDQVGTGVGLAKQELTTFLAEVIVTVRGLAGTADDVAVNLKASVAGLKAAASRSPLVYGPLPDNTPAGTVLAGAYEFRIDAADTNMPFTPWRILLGIVLVAIGAVLGGTLIKRRAAGGGSPELQATPVAG